MFLIRFRFFPIFETNTKYSFQIQKMSAILHQNSEDNVHLQDSCKSRKESKFITVLKHIYSIIIEDQTELQIASENAQFSHEMAQKARLQKDDIDKSLQESSSKNVKDADFINRLVFAFEYQKTREIQWENCAKEIEKWIFSGATYRVTHACPEYEDFGL